MRLFVAINFDEEVKRALVSIQGELKKHTARGNFTAYENLHLTLAFLGEVTGGRIGAAQAAVRAVTVPPFELCIRGVGSFRRAGGDILWAGVEAGGELTALHGRLAAQLALAGFMLEDRTFTPHLTLARGAVPEEGFDRTALSCRLGVLRARVSKISLMKSERLNGRLTYTELS